MMRKILIIIALLMAIVWPKPLRSLRPLETLRTLKTLKALRPSPGTEGRQPFRVMFYNVENLFDTEDNPLTDDDEFLPDGARRWTKKRYYRKLNQIAKVIGAAGEWDSPALVGLCEVENDTALTHLIRRTPLRNRQYHYCMTHGPDKRGINVALLYQRDKFRHLGHSALPVRFRQAGGRGTRDILHVFGEIISGDTLDAIVCHFPSMYGGGKETEGRRADAALAVRRLCDSLLAVRHHPRVILMGDFNMEPRSRYLASATPEGFINLFMDKQTKTSTGGSQKYRGKWSQLDQIIIHKTLMDNTSAMRYLPGGAGTLSFPFLLADDKTRGGQRPFRTYYGYEYEGGFSDHLPVIADFSVSLPVKD